MYHTSGISALANRACISATAELDPRVHTFSSFLFSHNERALQRKVKSLSSRIKQKDALIAQLRALIAASPPHSPPPVSENIAQEEAQPPQRPQPPTLPLQSTAFSRLLAELRERQAQTHRRVLSDVTNSLNPILPSDDESIPAADEPLSLSADGIDFDDSSEEDSDAEPSESPMGSQVEGHLCTAFRITAQHTTHPAVAVNDPAPIPAQPSTDEGVIVHVEDEEPQEDAQGTDDAEQQPEGTGCEESLARPEGETQPSTSPAPLSPTPGRPKRAREEQQVDEEGAATVLSEWKRAKESGGATETSTASSSSSVRGGGFVAMQPLRPRLQPFAALQRTAATLTPYRALSARSMALAVASPLRFAQPQL